MRHRALVSVASIALLLAAGACGEANTAPVRLGGDQVPGDSCKVTTKVLPTRPADFSASVLDMQLLAGWTPGGFYEYVHDLSTTTSIDTIPFADVHVSSASHVFLKGPGGSITASSGCALQVGDSLIVWRDFSYMLPSEEDPRPGFYAVSALIIRPATP